MRSSIVPSVPRMTSRPSPQVGRPSGVNQSTRMIAARAVALEQELAEILEAGQVGMADIADGARDDLARPAIR